MPNDSRKPNPLLGQSAWGLVGEVVLVGGGLINFVVLVTLLTKEDYGLVGSVQAIAAPAYALALMGAPFLLMRTVARTGDRQEAWRVTVTTLLVGSLVVTGLLVLGQPLLLGGAPLLPYTLMLISTGAITVYHELFFALSMGLERLQLGVAARMIGTVSRLAALAVFALSSTHTFSTWAWFAFLANMTAGIMITLLVGRLLGVRFGLTRPTVWFNNARAGYGFAMNGLSEGVLDASDRPILHNSGFRAETGEYTAAARLVTFSFIPILAIMRALTAELLREGRDGVSGPLRVTRRVLPMVAVLGLVMSAATFVFAPVITFFLGDRYEPTVEILRWLSIVPAIKAVQFLAGNALDAGQRQLTRFWLTMGAAGLNLGLNLVFIPRYSWKAAAVTTVTAEAVLMIALWGALVLLHRRQRRSERQISVSV